jgi:ankyrin repeat protein
LLLIESGADVNVAGKNGVIRYAAQAGCVEVVKSLLETGADLARDKLDSAILHYAVNADPTISDARGCTPLDAARLGCSELAELLFK